MIKEIGTRIKFDSYNSKFKEEEVEGIITEHIYLESTEDLTKRIETGSKDIKEQLTYVIKPDFKFWNGEGDVCFRSHKELFGEAIYK